MEIASRLPAVVLLLLSALKAQSPPSAPYPPPGRLIDAGGYRVHLFCTGQGSPTVMIVGAGFSFDWDLVQPEVGRRTRTCVYDAAGTAWSDPGPGPECFSRVVEIHRLLANAGERSPLVLVGLSIGALVARLYAAQYPNEVAGMVIIDHPFLDPAIAVPSPAPRPKLDSPPVLISAAPVDIDAAEDVSALPARDQELHRWALSLNPVRPNVETAERCRAEVERITRNHAHPLGRLPLAVVSTGNQNLDYTVLQQKLLTLSETSRQFIAARSGHAIHLDQPDEVIRAIAWVVEAPPR